MVAAGILAKGTSLRIAEALGIGDAAKASQCTVCHSPMENVHVSRLAEEIKKTPDRGVSCESCHGAAGEWLRFHTRRDVTFQQMLAVGLRDMNDIRGRANACVACHLNIDESVRQAGHPELFFELDGLLVAQPPHYVDARPSLGPRSWLTGQAVGLREMSWKLSKARDERLLARWKALTWLLKLTDEGGKGLPFDEDFSAMQKAADALAQRAAGGTWTNNQIVGLLEKYASTHGEFDAAQSERNELRRKAEVLVPALDRLWAALKKEARLDSPAVENEMDAANILARQQDDFEPAQFAMVLRRLKAQLAPFLKK